MRCERRARRARAQKKAKVTRGQRAILEVVSALEGAPWRVYFDGDEPIGVESEQGAVFGLAAFDREWGAIDAFPPSERGELAVAALSAAREEWAHRLVAATSGTVERFLAGLEGAVIVGPERIDRVGAPLEQLAIAALGMD